MDISREFIKNAGEESGTDKVSHHGYERFYSDFLNRSKIKNQILEIGYGEGRSINFWKKIFPDSFLNMIDKDICEKGDGYEVYQCDQSSKEDLLKIKKKFESKSIDLIVDDGSHIPEHIILTFNIFFKSILNNGCSYVVEDIETSYWSNATCYGYKANYGLNSKNSIVNIFSLLNHWVNREFLRPNQKKILKRKFQSLNLDIETINMISSITFGQNCICITKNLDEDFVFQERDYRFKFRHNIFFKILDKIIPKLILKKIISDPTRKQKVKHFLKKFKIFI